MRRLHILYLTQYLEIGGLETLIVEMCKRIDKGRFAASVLCLNGYDPWYAASLRECGVTTALIRKRHRYDYRFFRTVSRHLIDNRVDVVHAHGGCFFYSAIAVLLSRVPRFIYTAHGVPLAAPIRSALEDNVAALGCDKIVSVSADIHSTLSRRLPLARGKITTILNGIDAGRFRPLTRIDERRALAAHYRLPAGAFVVGSVGRLEPVKNYPMLLRAFARLANDGREPSHLVLVGEGSRQSELESVAKELGLAANVTFLGMQYRVSEILPLFDVFALTSITEGTSMSLLEAQACGVPAVVTDVGGNRAVIQEGKNGFVCPLNDTSAMAAALSRLRADPELARRMGASGRARVLERFDLDSMMRRYEDLYLEVSAS